jgi:hypothetical protein
MIASLADAWRWYKSVRDLTLTMQRLGQRHWDELPWEGALGRDERLRGLEAPAILEQCETALDDLNDLGVLLLFSVFEAKVRARVLNDLDRELPLLRHIALRSAGDAVREAVEFGSFFKVLEPYKAIDADLIEQVNQVRRYRNWVAHGRRGEPSAAVSPEVAFERLQRLLDRLEEAPPSP